MKLKRLIVFYILIFMQGNLLGQTFEGVSQTLKFKAFSLEQGLSQSSVLCILQDDKGFLWFGTRDGLNKYDGNTFKVYRHNSEDSTSLSSSYIKSLFQDDNGTLWVGTRNGLNKYLSESDVFQRFIYPDSRGTYEDEIWNIVPDDKNHFWAATNYGLGRFDTYKEEYEYYVHDEKDSVSLSNNLVRALIRTEDGNLWVKTIGKIDFFDKKTRAFKHYDYPEGSSVEENISSKTTLFEDSKKNIWMGFEGGLTIYNLELDRFKFFRLPSKKECAITDVVRSMVEDDIGNLWVGTYKGLYVIDAKRSSISHFVHDENDHNSLSQNSIYSMYKDHKGDIWVGTYAGGVNYYDRSYDLFKHFSSGTNNSKLNYKVVSSIVQDPEDNLWIGTEGGGINLYNKKTGRFTYYVHEKDNPNSLSTNNVKAMIRDHAGNYWIGTHDGGLNFLNPHVRPFYFKKYKNIPNDSKSLSDNRIVSLFEDVQNKIWIGTSGGGINMLDPKTKAIVRVSDPSEAVGKIVYTISSDQEDALLIGGSKGLSRLDKETMELSPIHFKEQDNGSIGPSAILCTYIDDQQNIWIGTEGDGLFRYNENSNIRNHYGVSHGLPNDIIYGIVSDRSDNIWLSTNHGLSRLNLKTETFKNFNASDGLQGNEFNYGAYLKNRYGELLFGGTNGFTIFNSARILSNTYIPPVSITSFKVNNKPFLNVTDSLTEVTLKHNQNVLDFDFVSLSYTQPDKNKYAYKLEGFDKEWNYIENRKSATYTNLDSGEYTFRVKASNNDGLWNETGATLTFTILPAPWRTWWAYLLYSILVLTALLIIRKYSIQRIHDRNELRHERLEKERIEEVNKLKLQLFTDISHDFRTPLTLILGPLERMLKRNEGDGFIHKQHKIMHRNTNVLMQLVNQLLDFRKSESGKLQLHASKNNFISSIKDMKLAFEDIAKAKHINYSLTFTNDVIELWFDKIKLQKIIYNLLSNAFKFTPKYGKISLHISIEKKVKTGSSPNLVKLIVKNSGIGISKNNIKYIFDRFYKIGENSGTGIGLALTKNLVELHQGFISVKSNEKEGTSFSILLPMGNDHLTDNQITNADPTISDNTLFDFNTSVHLEKEALMEEVALTNTDNPINKSLPSILLVEDNFELRVFIKNIFKNKHNVFEASNGKEALKIAKENHIDLILSDIMMPVMDGVELCNTLKSNLITSHIPVILLTAKTSKESRIHGYETGADAYISKPFDPVVLEIRVEKLITSRKSLRDKFRKDLITEPKEIAATSADEQFLEKAFQLVEQNLNNPEFTIKMFTAEMNMSRSVLYRKLKVVSGQSISEFIRTIKLKRAAQLIRNQKEMNISEIAYDLGFNDLKHFRKVFRKLFNELPSQYRNSNSKAH